MEIRAYASVLHSSPRVINHQVNNVLEIKLKSEKFKSRYHTHRVDFYGLFVHLLCRTCVFAYGTIPVTDSGPPPSFVRN